MLLSQSASSAKYINPRRAFCCALIEDTDCNSYWSGGFREKRDCERLRLDVQLVYAVLSKRTSRDSPVAEVLRN